jgi:hypothetical protein
MDSESLARIRVTREAPLADIIKEAYLGKEPEVGGYLAIRGVPKELERDMQIDVVKTMRSRLVDLALCHQPWDNILVAIKFATNQKTALEQTWPFLQERAEEVLEPVEYYGAFQKGSRMYPPWRDGQVCFLEPLEPVADSVTCVGSMGRTIICHKKTGPTQPASG